MYAPEIEKVKEFCDSFDKNGAVIFFVDEKELGYASYGEDEEWCKFMQKLGDKLYNYMEMEIIWKWKLDV
jgi:hypothetical protein